MLWAMRALRPFRRTRHGRQPADVERRLRVLFLATATRPPLGADTWVHAQIVRGLDRSRHQVHAACMFGTVGHPTPTYGALREIPDLLLFPVNLGRELVSSTRRGRIWETVRTVPALFGLFRLAAYVWDHKIDVIHTSDRPRDALAAVLLSRVTRAKCVIHSHVGYGEWMSITLRWALKKADANFTVSAFVARTLVESGNDPARIYVVLNGIDPAKWRPGTGRAEARDELGVRGDAPVVITICRLFPSKGPAELIQALAANAQFPEARLFIVGEEMVPGYAAELTSLADELGVGERVRFLGRRPDIERLLAAADIYAMPSIGEPCSIAFLEAMAMALPIVALESGGAPEQIMHGATGLLSMTGDRAGLAANLRPLLQDPGLRTLMGEAGRDRLATHFTTQRMVRDVEVAYQAVVFGPGAEVADTEDSCDELVG